MLVNAPAGRPLPVYGDGSNVRDGLCAEDHGRAVEQVLLAAKVGATYNVGGRNEWTNIDIVRLLCELADQTFAQDRELAGIPALACGGGAESLITFVKDRPGHDGRYAIDATKSDRDLGIVPGESFETGSGKTVTWYLAPEAWWRGIMDGSYRDWIRRQYAEVSD